jgi:hypothetical protein
MNTLRLEYIRVIWGAYERQAVACARNVSKKWDFPLSFFFVPVIFNAAAQFKSMKLLPSTA